MNNTHFFANAQNLAANARDNATTNDKNQQKKQERWKAMSNNARKITQDVIVLGSDMERHVSAQHAKAMMNFGLPTIGQQTVPINQERNDKSSLPFSYSHVSKLWDRMLTTLWQSLGVKTLIEPLTYNLGTVEVPPKANGSDSILTYAIKNTDLEVTVDTTTTTFLLSLPPEFAQIRTIILTLPQLNRMKNKENTSTVKADYIILIDITPPLASAQASSSSAPSPPQKMRVVFHGGQYLYSTHCVNKLAEWCTRLKTALLHNKLP
eukprot:6213176-Pleurochrysis_carterae.AAC.1